MKECPECGYIEETFSEKVKRKVSYWRWKTRRAFLSEEQRDREDAFERMKYDMLQRQIRDEMLQAFKDSPPIIRPTKEREKHWRGGPHIVPKE